MLQRERPQLAPQPDVVDVQVRRLAVIDEYELGRLVAPSTRS